MNANARFLVAIQPAAKTAILTAIAGHYGITTVEAYEEVADDEAEGLLEYMVGAERAAASALMQRHGMR